MEADWSIEIGADLPRIVVPWSEAAQGFGDSQAAEDGSRKEGGERLEELENGDSLDLRFGGVRSEGLRSEGLPPQGLPSEALHPGAPRVDEPWSGSLRFVDLQADPGAVAALPEVAGFPALARALVRLNSAGSLGFTSKCDVFPIDPDEIDPSEFDTEGEIHAGLGCYIDLVLHDGEVFSSFGAHEAWLRRTVQRLREGTQLPCARVELVLRAATIFEQEGFGVTIYVAGCGANEAAARTSLEAALDAVIGFLVAAPASQEAI